MRLLFDAQSDVVLVWPCSQGAGQGVGVRVLFDVLKVRWHLLLLKVLKVGLLGDEQAG